MSRPRYSDLGDSCLTAHALELIGQRWTYPVMRELMLGPQRFSDLLADINGITPAVLSTRLKEMLDNGLVVSAATTTRAAGRQYALSDWALSLAPVLRELGRWAQGSPTKPSHVGLTPDASVQAMLTLADDRPLQPPVVGKLLLTDTRRDQGIEHPYQVTWDQDGMSIRRGNAEGACFTIRTDSSVWAETIFSETAPDDVPLSISGSAEEAHRLVQSLRPG